MRTRVDLDESLLRAAQDISGTSEHSALIRAALEALIERESARRLAQLGGSEPHFDMFPGAGRPRIHE